MIEYPTGHDTSREYNAAEHKQRAHTVRRFIHCSRRPKPALERASPTSACPRRRVVSTIRASTSNARHFISSSCCPKLAQEHAFPQVVDQHSEIDEGL